MHSMATSLYLAKEPFELTLGFFNLASQAWLLAMTLRPLVNFNLAVLNSVIFGKILAKFSR